jgi:hypothetical protein
MLIQYPIDAVPENSANGRGLWILHQAEKKQQRESGKAKTFFNWDKKSLSDRHHLTNLIMAIRREYLPATLG